MHPPSRMGAGGQGDDLLRPTGHRPSGLGTYTKPLAKKGHHLSMRILAFELVFFVQYGRFPEFTLGYQFSRRPSMHMCARVYTHPQFQKPGAPPPTDSTLLRAQVLKPSEEPFPGHDRLSIIRAVAFPPQDSLMACITQASAQTSPLRRPSLTPSHRPSCPWLPPFPAQPPFSLPATIFHIGIYFSVPTTRMKLVLASCATLSRLTSISFILPIQ